MGKSTLKVSIVKIEDLLFKHARTRVVGIRPHPDGRHVILEIQGERVPDAEEVQCITRQIVETDFVKVR